MKTLNRIWRWWTNRKRLKEYAASQHRFMRELATASPTWTLRTCPVCGKLLQTFTARQSHVAQVHRENFVSRADMLNAFLEENSSLRKLFRKLTHQNARAGVKRYWTGATAWFSQVR